jgi:hypothetical protein
MHMHRLLILGGALCFGLIIIAGCASSELVDIWSDSSYQAPALNKILVISSGKNPVKRRIWEDAFTSELAKHNVAATPSYRLFPDAVPDTDQVSQTVQANSFDGVLITRWLPSETRTQYVPAYVTIEQNTRYDRRRDRFITYYWNLEHAGVADSQRVNIRSIDVWTTKNDGQMIWSGTSRTPESNSEQTVRPEIVKLVMVELTRQHIVASGK